MSDYERTWKRLLPLHPRHLRVLQPEHLRQARRPIVVEAFADVGDRFYEPCGECGAMRERHADSPRSHGIRRGRLPTCGVRSLAPRSHAHTGEERRPRSITTSWAACAYRSSSERFQRMRIIPKPNSNEHVSYVLQYIDLLPNDGLILEHLRENLDATSTFLRSMPAELLEYRYSPGKWTVKEIVQHLTDDERIYAYRALRFARGDATELPGFDQDAYTPETQANSRRLDDLLAEFSSVRAATLTLYAGLKDDVLIRTGVASGNVMSVRAIAYHIAGHELRHVNIIQERYLSVSGSGAPPN